VGGDEIQKPQGTRLCNSSGALPHLASPPLVRVLLGYAAITWSRNSKEGQRDPSDVARNNTQRCVLRVSDSSVDRRD
jgi:hypothetical protein